MRLYDIFRGCASCEPHDVFISYNFFCTRYAVTLRLCWYYGYVQVLRLRKLGFVRGFVVAQVYSLTFRFYVESNSEFIIFPFCKFSIKTHTSRTEKNKFLRSLHIFATIFMSYNAIETEKFLFLSAFHGYRYVQFLVYYICSCVLYDQVKICSESGLARITHIFIHKYTNTIMVNGS